MGTVTGFAGWQSASNALISPTKDFAVADTLTILKGAHTLKTGLLGIFNTKKQNGRSQYAGNVELQPVRQPELDRQRLRGRAPRQLPHATREAQLDPIGRFRFWQFEAFVTDSWRITPNFSVELGVRYTYHYPTVTRRQQPHGLRPQRLRPGAGGHGQHERHARARHRQPLQRPGPPRRRARLRGGRRAERGQPRGAGDPDRRQPRHLRPAAPLHAARQLRVVARRRRQDLRPRRDRPLLRPPRGQPVLRPAEQPALRPQLVLRERQPRQPRRRRGSRARAVGQHAVGLDRLRDRRASGTGA